MKKVSLIVLAIVVVLAIMFSPAYATEKKISDNASDNCSMARFSVVITYDGNAINYNFNEKVVNNKGVSIAKIYRGFEKRSPAVVKEVMTVKGVESFSLYNYKLVVVKGEVFDEREIIKKISPIIRKYYFSEKDLFVIGGISDREKREMNNYLSPYSFYAAYALYNYYSYYQSGYDFPHYSRRSQSRFSGQWQK